MNKPTKKLSKSINKSLTQIIDTNQGQLRRVPNHILALSLFLCINVLSQGIADILLKIIGYTRFLPAMPWRVDFLFLTAISVLMGYRSFTGMRHRKFDVTRNSIELGLLVEISLVVGDVLFVMEQISTMPIVLFLRLPFLVLTSINIVILLYNYRALKLRHWLQ